MTQRPDPRLHTTAVRNMMSVASPAPPDRTAAAPTPEPSLSPPAPPSPLPSAPPAALAAIGAIASGESRARLYVVTEPLDDGG